MSYYVGEREIWTRSLATSQLFLGQIEALAKIIKRPSGVLDTKMDEVLIDPPELRAFLDATFDYLGRSGSLPLREMARGVMRVALFLYGRATGEAYAIPDGFADIGDDLDQVD